MLTFSDWCYGSPSNTISRIFFPGGGGYPPHSAEIFFAWSGEIIGYPLTTFAESAGPRYLRPLGPHHAMLIFWSETLTDASFCAFSIPAFSNFCCTFQPLFPILAFYHLLIQVVYIVHLSSFLLLLSVSMHPRNYKYNHNVCSSSQGDVNVNLQQLFNFLPFMTMFWCKNAKVNRDVASNKPTLFKWKRTT